MHLDKQLSLFAASPCLPAVRRAEPAQGLDVERIVLSKGSLDTTEREAFVWKVCSAYPNASVVEALATPHNRVPVAAATHVERVATGKRILVLGTLSPQRAVWRNELRSRAWPEEMCFSIYGFCPYDCAYCYLAGSPGVWHSPTVKIFVNLPEIIERIDRLARDARRPVTFYLGRFQDGLALDSLTGYSTELVPFFAQHPYARQLIQTKSSSVERLLELNHNERTAISWTLTPPEIAERYERRAPSVSTRMAAMQRCAERGYPVRASIAPVIPHGNWQSTYLDFVRHVLEQAKVERLLVSEACMDPRSLSLLEAREGADNAISRSLASRPREECDRAFYRKETCAHLFQQIAAIGRDFGCRRVVIDEGHGRTMALEFSHQHASNSANS